MDWSIDMAITKLECPPGVKHQGPQVLNLTEEQTDRVQVVLQDNKVLASFLPL